MSFQSDDKSAFIAQQVMHHIGENHLQPNPAVFAVLYNYFGYSNAEIMRAMVALKSDGRALTTSFCEELHEKFLSTTRQENAMEDISSKIHKTLEEVSDIVRHSGVAHKEYGDSLQKQSAKMSSTTDFNDLKTMIAELVSDTQNMVKENQALQTKLSSSAGEVQQMRQQLDTLQQESVTDSLTGIANRKAFDTQLKKTAADCLDRHRPLSLMMVDVDHFKNFNDTYGHPVGDQILKLVCKVIGDNLQNGEILYRYGGEEFAVLVPGFRLREVEKLADKLRERIAAKDIVDQSKGEKMGRISVSLGVTQLEPEEALSQFVERADRALYNAKETGRNKVVALEFDPKLHDTHTRQLRDIA